MTTTPARTAARMVMLVLVLASGLALFFTMVGDRSTAMVICGAGVALALGVLLFGGLLVARSRQ